MLLACSQSHYCFALSILLLRSFQSKSFFKTCQRTALPSSMYIATAAHFAIRYASCEIILCTLASVLKLCFVLGAAGAPRSKINKVMAASVTAVATRAVRQRLFRSLFMGLSTSRTSPSVRRIFTALIFERLGCCRPSSDFPNDTWN